MESSAKLVTVLALLVALLLTVSSALTASSASSRDNAYTPILVYVNASTVPQNFELISLASCGNGTLRVALYSGSNETHVDLIIVYARHGARYTSYDIASCIATALGKRLYEVTWVLKGGLRVPAPNATMSPATIHATVMRQEAPRKTVTSTTVTRKATTTVLVATIPTTASTQRAIKEATSTTPYHVSKTTSTTAAAGTATPVSMASNNTYPGGGPGPGPRERLGIVLGSAIAAAALVYMAWRTRPA